MEYRVWANYITNFPKTPGDDDDTDYPGHPVPRRQIQTRYSCTETPKTPELV